MALIHAAELAPTKRELLAEWLPAQPWAPPGAGAVEVMGSFRFDDPGGEVGIETHLVRYGGEVLQVPLTYRPAPLPGAEGALVGTTEHSALETRWVYDDCRDVAYIRMAAVSTLTGVGQAVEVQVGADEEHTWPPGVRLSFSGSVTGRVRIDGWLALSTAAEWTVWRNPAAELRVSRRPVPSEDVDAAGSSEAAVMSGSLLGHPAPLVLATATRTSG